LNIEPKDHKRGQAPQPDLPVPVRNKEETMDGNAEKKESLAKKAWCSTWDFVVNSARRTQILGKYSQACWQQSKIKKAERELGEKSFQALERGETNPLTAPEVNEAVQQVKELREQKEKTYQDIAEIKERISSSCVIPTPEEPGGVEENPPVP
jgi:chromosome segregation ATPase